LRIAICTTTVPFIEGGAKNFVEWLRDEINSIENTEAEIFYLPQVENPKTLLSQMQAFGELDFSFADLVICVRPQAHAVSHPRKIVWLIHQIRALYDLWGSDLVRSDMSRQGMETRRKIIELDTTLLMSSKKVFTNSKTVSARLQRFNNVESTVLYPPLPKSFINLNSGSDGSIVYVSRIERHKRQDLLIRALPYTKSQVKVQILGATNDTDYLAELESLVAKYGLENRVFLPGRWISDEEKTLRLGHCLAVAYFPIDEDSYGYPTLEACLSKKPILTSTDSGGVLELVKHKWNGLVADPTPREIAKSMDLLFNNPELAITLGDHAQKTPENLGITWEKVKKELLS
jgi:glycosyltransferase involved in cell wall biosynthesis